MTERPYWHELTPAERQAIVDSGLTIGTLLARYRQPDWCHYPEALAGSYGCWALMDCSRSVSEASCGDCELCKPRPQ